jgi:(2Fe-2S) ferredoxin
MDRPQEIHSCHVCVNLSCVEGGSKAIAERIVQQLDGSGIEVKTHICFGACWMGPNIVLYPQGTWYSNVQLKDVDEIVAHAKGGPPVDRLIYTGDAQLHELVISILDAGLS